MPNEINKILQNALDSSAKPSLSSADMENISRITEAAVSGRNKSALAVLITLCVKKIASPKQDIRLHQAKITGGFSGRRTDTIFVTPFLRANDFPAPGESGWLTRSFEQSAPYDCNYPGAITPRTVKKAFLSLVNKVETKTGVADIFLNQIFFNLKKFRETSQSLVLGKPKNRSVIDTVGLVESLWNERIPSASRVPVIAVYGAYQCLVNEVKRYKDHELLPLLRHNASDLKTQRVGDIDLIKDSKPIEAVEVKHEIEIKPNLVTAVIEKVKGTSVERYYILSTNENMSEVASISKLTTNTRQIHGCEIIVNGVAATLKYYLRLLSNTNSFIHNFVTTLEEDTDISYDMKIAWNNITQGGEQSN